MSIQSIGADSFGEVLTNALERMAFVFAEPSNETPGEVFAQTVAHATVRVSGTISIVLCVSATQGMVVEVASGMLGIDGEDIDPDEHARAVVGELANIFGGELVMQMTHGDESVSLSLPRECVDEEAGALLDRTKNGGFAVCLGTENGQLLVTVGQA